jgi:hypothetical protein
LSEGILEWFRDEAEREGRGYQTAINQALRNYIKQDERPIQDIVRERWYERNFENLKRQAKERKNYQYIIKVTFGVASSHVTKFILSIIHKKVGLSLILDFRF